MNIKRMKELLRANSPEGTDRLPVVPDIHLTPSPTKKVRFSDGTVVAMNRRERRRNKIYNKK